MALCKPASPLMIRSFKMPFSALLITPLSSRSEAVLMRKIDEE